MGKSRWDTLYLSLHPATEPASSALLLVIRTSRLLPRHLVDNLYFDLSRPVADRTGHDPSSDCPHVQLREINNVPAVCTDVNALP
jgi:hypothetical protein